MTLRVISESSGNREGSYFNKEGSSNNFHFDTKDNTSSTSQEQIDELTVENVNADSIFNGQQLTCVPLNRLPSGVNQSSMITTFERSVSEQARSNDLKEFEIELKMRSMKLKEAQIAVNCDSNVLERFKLSMGISKANFKAEKFKTELEDSRHTQLLKKCADFLVAGLLIMLTALGYGTYIHSHQRLTEATESCNPMKVNINNVLVLFNQWSMVDFKHLITYFRSQVLGGNRWRLLVQGSKSFDVKFKFLLECYSAY